MRRKKLIVSWGDDYENKIEQFYCLDCGEIWSRSGFHYHSQTFTMTDDEAERRVNELINDMDLFVSDVKMKLENRFSDGKMRGRSSFNGHAQMNPFIGIRFHPSHTRLLPPVTLPTRRPLPRALENFPTIQPPPPEEHPDHADHFDEFEIFDDHDGFDEYDEYDDENDDDEMDTFPDISQFFSTNGFDEKRFSRFAQDYLRQKHKAQSKKTVSKKKWRQ